MLPLHTRVAAIDDVEDHLQKVAWGLAKAGLCPVPFLFEDGRLESPPDRPVPGIRLVFSDIHVTAGGSFNPQTNASAIIKCLKQIIEGGPYALIFWSQHPDEVDEIRKQIDDRADKAGLIPPIGYGRIDKNAVFNTAAGKGEDDEFNAQLLRELILQQVSGFNTLAAATSWDDRVARAAARTTNQLFSLSSPSPNPTETWEQLLAFLACEAVGRHQAEPDIRSALDAALFPLLEDQLTLIGGEPQRSNDDLGQISGIIQARRPKRPKSISAAHLNSRYLIEQLPADCLGLMWGRGIVTELGGSFINSGPFMAAFGCCAEDLIRKEFTYSDLSPEEKLKTRLHIVELGPECDHVQGKIASHRYLLALLVPSSVMEKCTEKGKYRNASIVDTGELALNGYAETCHLLISCRCFMALGSRQKIEGKCKLRLRRSLLDEVAHNYTTHARRPGVMRFAS